MKAVVLAGIAPGCAMPPRWLLLMALFLTLTRTTPAYSQGVALRLGIGPTYANALGGAGLIALEVHVGNAVIVRGEGRAASVSDEAQLVSGGVAFGFATSRPGARPRPYLLGTFGWGIDAREGDGLTSIGALVGVDSGRPLGLFAELRYDHLTQDTQSAPYYHLPSDQVTLLAGFRIGSF